MSSPLVHVVIPVYNGAAFIGRCLESVAEQSHPNWVATVVDNRSTDGTGNIAERIAAGDSRFQVRRFEEFVDQCGNYNRALALTLPHSQYIKVLEADNWLFPDALRLSVAMAESDPEIAVVGSYWLRGARVDGWGLDPELRVLSGDEAFRIYFRRRTYLFGTPSTLLFRTDHVKSMSRGFRPGLFYDDLEYCARILRDRKFGFVHQVLTFVRDDNGGLFSEVRGLDYEEAMRYFLISEYGPGWFSGGELSELTQQCRKQYLRRLGRSALANRGEAYWNFHKDLFAANGMKFSRAAIARAMCGAVLDHGRRPFASLWR